MNQKNTHISWQRNYRSTYAKRAGETSFQLILEESDIQVIAQKNMAKEMLETLRKLRADIKAWQILHPTFQTSLMPLPIPQSAPEVVTRMYKGASKAGVGPFAAVAGTISQMLAENHVHNSPDIIVENGGDIYIFSQKPRTVALLADPKSKACLGLQFDINHFPLALCASSATIGHSLSLGNGELAVVIAKDGSLADAVATALGNRLRNSQSIEIALNFAQNIDGIEGVFIQCDEAIAAWGNITLTNV